MSDVVAAGIVDLSVVVVGTLDVDAIVEEAPLLC